MGTSIRPADTGMPPPFRWALGLAFGATAAILLYGLGLTLAEAFDRRDVHPLRLLDPQHVGDQPAPDFTLPDFRGRSHSLADHRGRPVVLNFWSKDCPPCLREMPSLIRLARIGRERGTFSVITVTVDQDWDQVREVFGGGEPPLPILFDPERRVVTELYGTDMFPETYLIDSQGRIRARFDGSRPWDSPVVLNLLGSL